MKMSSDPLDLGELSNDEDLKKRLTDFRKSVENVGEVLEEFLTIYNYDSLSDEDKVRYDLFLAFSINSLFWLYLRTQGVDPSQHELKSELNRVKQYMMKSKQVHDKLTKMPRLNQDAAQRFVRSGLWTPKEKNDGSEIHTTTVTHSLKRKRQDDDDDG